MRILVAEDHPTLARTLVDGLREEGFVVDVTFNGDEALHLAQVNPYNCIILDMMLPGKSGWEVLESLRASNYPAPILCLTAMDSVDDRVRGLNLGADDYLPKPFHWQELMARLRALIRRSHNIASPVITIGDLQLNTTTMTVTRGGAPIKLSATEFRILAYLAHRAGDVITRAELWDHLYDQHDEANSNVIDVYIGYLRRKIDRGHDVKLIQTRRGLGYVLSPEGGDA